MDRRGVAPPSPGCRPSVFLLSLSARRAGWNQTTVFGLSDRCLATRRHLGKLRTGIEPASATYQAATLPFELPQHRAENRNRTCNLRFTKPALYHLSYPGESWRQVLRPRHPHYRCGALLVELRQRKWSRRESNSQVACLQGRCIPVVLRPRIERVGRAPTSYRL